MDNENTNTATEEVVVKRFIESSAKNLDVARQERQLFIKIMGDKLNEPGDTEEVRILNGHRAVLGYSYRLTREIVGLSLGDMTHKCDVGSEEMIECERTGFLDSYWDRDLLDDSDGNFIKMIYVAWLKREIIFLDIDFYENPFADILEFNDAAIADINREISDFGENLDVNYIHSLGLIKKSYEIINDILEPYRTY